MKLSKKEVEKLFKLSKIKKNDALFEKICEKLNDVMVMVDQTQRVDCSNLDPMSYISTANDAIREDKVVTLNSRDDLFANLVPKEKEFSMKTGYFRVPKVL